jgi:hypothetical protein
MQSAVDLEPDWVQCDVAVYWHLFLSVNRHHMFTYQWNMMLCNRYAGRDIMKRAILQRRMGKAEGQSGQAGTPI